MMIRFTPNLIPIFTFGSQYVCQISARLKYAYVSYSDFCKVCEKKKKNKKDKMKIFFQKFD